MWTEIAYAAAGFAGGAGAGFSFGWHTAHGWYRSTPDHREAVREELQRMVNVEQVEYNARQRKVEMMRAGVKTQRLEPNPKDPVRIHRMRMRRRLIRPLEDG